MFGICCYMCVSFLLFWSLKSVGNFSEAPESCLFCKSRNACELATAPLLKGTGASAPSVPWQYNRGGGNRQGNLHEGTIGKAI